jgi:hypothetical protein
VLLIDKLRGALKIDEMVVRARSFCGYLGYNTEQLSKCAASNLRHDAETRKKRRTRNARREHCYENNKRRCSQGSARLVTVAPTVPSIVPKQSEGGGRKKLLA